MRNILLFENSSSVTDFFRNIVEKYFEDCRLQCFIPGSHIVQTCLEHNPLVIIIDFHSTGIHRTKLSQHIKDDEQLRHIPLIAIGARDNKISIKNDRQSLPDYYIPQPFNVENVRDILAICIRLGGLERMVSSDKKQLETLLFNKEKELWQEKEANKHSEELLRIERDFAKQVLDAMGQGLTITNSDGFFQYINPAFSRMLGYEPSDLIGTRPMEITFQEDMPILEEARSLRKQGVTSSYETRIKHKNGSLIYAMVTGVPFYKAGVVAGTIAVVTDITGLKHTEKRLQQISEEYEYIFNGAQDAIFLLKVMNRGYVFVRINHSFEKYTGFSNEMMAGKTPEEAFGKSRGAKLSRNYLRCLRAKKQISYEEEFSLNDDPRYWVTTLTPIMRDEVVEFIVGASMEITQYKHANQSQGE